MHWSLWHAFFVDSLTISHLGISGKRNCYCNCWKQIGCDGQYGKQSSQQPTWKRPCQCKSFILKNIILKYLIQDFESMVSQGSRVAGVREHFWVKVCQSKRRRSPRSSFHILRSYILPPRAPTKNRVCADPMTGPNQNSGSGPSPLPSGHANALNNV